MPDARRVWAEGRRDAGRQALGDEAHALQNASAGKVQVHVVVEDDVDHREAERRLGSDDANAGEALQIHCQRIADLVFHFLRAVTRPVREDDDLVVREVWNRIDGRGAQRPPAPAGQADVQGQHDEAVLQREFNESIDHESRHSSCRARARRYRPGPRVWADTRRREWLDEQDGEQEMFRDVRRRRGRLPRRPRDEWCLRRLRTTGGSDWRTERVMVDAKAVAD